MQQQTQILNLGFRYINGLAISYSSTTVVNVAAGQVRDSTNQNDIVISASTLINIALSGVNGLDTGDLAASTLYYIYAIGSSGGLSASTVLFSASNTQPVLPANYDMFALIGCFYSNGSSQVANFTQVGSGSDRSIFYATGAAVVSAGNATSYTQIDCPLAPVLSNVVAYVNASITPGTAGQYVALRQHGSSATAPATKEVTGVVASQPQTVPTEIACDATPSFDYLVSNSAAAATITFVGYRMSLV